MKKIIVGIVAGFALLSAVSSVQATTLVAGTGDTLTESDIFWISSEGYAPEQIYSQEDMPDFTSVQLTGAYAAAYADPSVDIDISIWLQDYKEDWYVLSGAAFDADGYYSFGTGGVEIFKLSGIDSYVGESIFTVGLTLPGVTQDGGTIYQTPKHNVPEPTTLLLLASGLLGFGLRKKQ